MRTDRAGLRSTPLGAGAVLTAVMAWSLINVIVKIVHVPAITFAFYRLWLGSAVMLATTWALGRRLTWGVIRRSLPGGVLFGLNVVLFFSALKRTSVADVLIIQSVQPALVMLAAGPMFGERVTGYELAWAGVSIGGVILVTLGSSTTPVWSLAGDVFAGGSLLVWTAYFLVSKRARRTIPAIEYMTAATIAASIVVTPMALLSGQRLGGVRGVDWLWLALFLAGGQGGHILLAWAHGQVDVSVSSLLILAEPIISVVAALVFLGEPLTGLEIAGGLVVVVAVGAIVRRATADRVLDEPEPAPS